MLTLPEKLAFLLLALTTGALTLKGFYEVFQVIRRGRPDRRWDRLPRRIVTTAVGVALQRTIFTARPVLGVFHTFILAAFTFYFLVNLVDLAEGFVAGFSTLYGTGVVALFNLVADVLSVLALAGMTAFLLRRFLLKPKSLRFNEGVLLLPQVPGGIRRDSLIVGGFILFHVGFRFLGQAFRIAEAGRPDRWAPFASLVARAFDSLSPAGLSAGIHVSWWIALGLIAVFFPYFPRSKHIHLFMAPLNLALARSRPRGALDPPTGGDGYGAARLEELTWPRVLDAYACIMCNRCQDVCPAHGSGRVLSPAALEINKRYLINGERTLLARGQPSSLPLLQAAISQEAVWACTTCFACVAICPVGNEPMMDIVDIRRRQVDQGASLDPGLQEALMSLTRHGNAFGQSPKLRGRWTQELGFSVKDARREPVELLWFVGDFASYDPRLQAVSRSLARVLHWAGVDFGILYDAERNAGNDVRRAGEEGLFEMLAEHNIEVLAKCRFRAVLTTDPHSYNTLRNEYPELGADYPVLHYTELLARLAAEGKLNFPRPLERRVTYHDPCYLARYNGVIEAPRELLRAMGATVVEMGRCRENTYCCGAGGGQVWMTDPGAGERPSENRIREALALDEVDTFVVACPKDVTMYTDAAKTLGQEERIRVVDIVELVEEALAVGEPVAA